MPERDLYQPQVPVATRRASRKGYTPRELTLVSVLSSVDLGVPHLIGCVLEGSAIE
jgi:hypothetical protein